MIDHCYWVLLVYDEAASDICCCMMDIERPTYTTINGLIGQVVTSLTGSLRFGGAPMSTSGSCPMCED
jgi:tubulin alpha